MLPEILASDENLAPFWYRLKKALSRGIFEILPTTVSYSNVEESSDKKLWLKIFH